MAWSSSSSSGKARSYSPWPRERNESGQATQPIEPSLLRRLVGGDVQCSPSAEVDAGPVGTHNEEA